MKNHHIAKKLSLPLTLIIIMLFLAGCMEENYPDPEKIGIVTTLFPLYEFAQAVGGEHVEVTLLLPPGAEPHSYEPKPSDIRKIANSDLFIYIGEEMEPWAHDILEGVTNKGFAVIDASAHAELLALGSHDEDHADDEDRNHEGSAHEEDSFRWAWLYLLDEGEYVWNISVSDGAYPDPFVKMIMLKTDEDIHDVEHLAEDIMGSDDIAIKEAGSVLRPIAMAYGLRFDDGSGRAVFRIRIENTGHYAFFTDLPYRNALDFHLFKESGGSEVIAIEEAKYDYHDEEDHHDHAHGEHDEHGHSDEENHHDHAHGEHDPHIWLDFENDKRIIDAIAQELALIDPENKDSYIENAILYKKLLTDLDLLYREGLSVCRHDEVISGGHNSLSYLANRYGFSFISVFGVTANEEPTPRKIAEIADLLVAHDIRYILFEELLDPKVADVLARETGAKTVEVSPGHNLRKDDLLAGVSFISIMERNLESLKTVMECE